MTTLRRAALISFSLATAFLGSGCGRDGLSSNESQEAASPEGVTVRRVFRIPNNLPIQWAAYQDGPSQWIPIQPIVKGGQEYELVLKDPSRQLGFVIAANLGLSHVEVSVTFLTVDDCLNGLDLRTSGPKSNVRTYHGTIGWSVAGLADDEHAMVSIAGRSFETLPPALGYSADADWPQTGDLLVTAGPLHGLPTRMVVRRNLRLVPDMTIPLIDLSGAEVVPLQVGQVSLTNTPIADEIYAGVSLVTAGGNVLMNEGVASAGDTVPFTFLPDSQQAPGDLYKVEYYYQSAAGAANVASYFHWPTGHHMVLPSLPSGATVSNRGGPSDVRLTAVWPVTEPGSIRFADYTQGTDAMNSKWWLIDISPSYAGGEGWTMTVPDLRDVAGWNSFWDLEVGTPTSWSVGSSPPSSGATARQDGTSETWTAQRGTLTP
jgi:hypothetical protein